MLAYQNAYPREGLFFKTRPSYTTMPNRRIITNVPDKQVCDNSIRTSKYTHLNFIPLNLIVQFSKVANIYFLVIGIMQMIDAISVSGGFPVIFVPLSIVVGVSAIKDYYEDLKRKQSDQEVNNKIVQKLSKDGWVEVPWKAILIGDIIKIKQNQQAAADIILLQSSDQKNSCFIETKNLDGETNLKFKRVKLEVGQDFPTTMSAPDLYLTHKEFNYEKPNPFIHTFTGSYKGNPLDNNSIILRGCALKITNWVTGVVVYSGYDSKIMLNSNKARQKKSRLEFKMGLIVAAIFVTQMCVTALSGIISTVLSTKTFQTQEVISSFSHFLIKWGSWILLFTNFVPISLIVSLEMVKYIQGINISKSKFKSSQPSEVIVQTSSLNEQLGQIQHLFSDKTGTLTCNYMNFKYMAIGNQVYGYDNDRSVIPDHITNVDFNDRQFIKKVQNLGQESLQQPQMKLQNFELFHMLISLTLCHNVIIEQNQKGQKKYNASSPDQLAFINMAKLCGWQYQGINSQNQLCYTNKGKQYRYRLLHLIEFDSDRKRMSVIVKKDDRVYVYCKGADNVIIDRLKDEKHLKKIQQHLKSWSVNGFRTLLFAMREIHLDAYDKWAKMYAYSLSRLQKTQETKKRTARRNVSIQEEKQQLQNARQSSRQIQLNMLGLGKIILDDFGAESAPPVQTPQQIMSKLLNDSALLTSHQIKFLEEHLTNFSESNDYTSAELEAMLEKQFTLIGASAIEDRLQQNVKETISSIREAGVKVWMLTGDKKETAINIGISCGLISEDMAVVQWTRDIDRTTELRKQIPSGRQCCIVVTGQDLLSESAQHKLLLLVNSCQAIICCRVTPKQKQDMVWLMRKNKYTTLGIGDGANDVNMINTAHVGVGIKGVEGAQAALCSDYAITEFQLLGELMLYHGRESYRKNSQLILFNFYKNLLLVLPQLWYGLSNQFSATNIYDPWIYQLYNVIYTSMPIIAFAVLDEQYSVEYSLSHPKEYQIGLKNRLFNFPSIIVWFISPIIYSFFLCVFSFEIMEDGISSEGYVYDIISTGMTIFAACVILCNLKIQMIAYKYSHGLLICTFFGIAAFYISCYLAEAWFRERGEMLNIVQWQITSVTYWLSIFETVGLIMILEIAMSRWKQLSKTQQHQPKSKSVDQLPGQEIELPMMSYLQSAQ